MGAGEHDEARAHDPGLIGRISAAGLRFLDRSIPATSRADADELRRCRVLIGLDVVSIATAFGVGGLRLATEGPSLVSLAAFGGGTAIAAIWIAFAHGLSRKWTGDLLLAFSTVALIAACVLDGGLRAQATPWFVVLPLMANFIGGRIRALIAWIISAISLAGFFAAELAGIIPAGPEDGGLLAVRLGALIGLASYIAIGTHIYETSRRDAELERTRLDQLRTEWVGLVSHELRTPLTSMRGALQLLDQQVTGDLPEPTREVIRLANRNCDRLNRLVSDVLDIERIEAGALDLRFDDVDLRRLVEEAVETNQAYAQVQRVVLRLEPGPNIAPIRADADRIKQVLDNLLSNAIKFSPSGGSVSTTVESTAAGVRVRVHDQGPGIPRQFRSRIFQRFAQADSAPTREQGGSGLGLSICKGLVERHGGEIGFESEPGSGSTFSFVLPRGPKAADPLASMRST